ncbi:DEAD/DEAH box helicase domain-containing protein [Friedmanniella luteola]|uniref:DEAD/DEAH box helicase domain-containing protein n=1 Tax=Friedmanniella luteola TaxID=546871 RepID=A0A1H1LIN2_9ACTN|nr:DEAD/DEAH box helicase [Friedmanniella luteola]SDR73729.1 DEAD/DEAH box helicase domain-containing protein [Friedmanniella luteola]
MSTGTGAARDLAAPAQTDEEEDGVRHVRALPARTGTHAPWPAWLPAELRDAFGRTGVDQPWQHQVRAAEAAWQGRHVALSTGTASGKTLGYLMPVLAATLTGRPPAGPLRPEPTGTAAWRVSGRPHTALYLAPTKALAHDQLRACTELGLSGWPIATVDGDTGPDARAWAREQAVYLLTNPDLLHFSLLPGHARWAGFLSSLRFVVVDEAHRYRGVFGSQVGLVLRRLRRLAAAYGADPVFVVASATAGDPGRTAAELLGVPRAAVTTVDEDCSSRGPVEVVLREPLSSTEDDTAALLARSVQAGAQTIAFVPSRRGAEVVARRAQQQLDAWARPAVDGEPSPAPRVAAYRGGYLAADRRKLEQALQDGRLAGVAATNALELGVDIAGMDAVVMAGFPGTRSAFWQQAGRAGRRGRPARVTLVTRAHPLDAYLTEHPSALLDEPVEPTVLHPGNPYLLGPQLAAAAQELPLTAEDAAWFGPHTEALAERLAAGGALRRRRDGWYWTRPERACDTIDLRGSRADQVEIIEVDTGRVLGHVDPVAADLAVHPGAVYLHGGETFLTEELDHEGLEALVRAARPGYLTQPQTSTAVEVLAEHDRRTLGRGHLHRGQIAVTSQVTGYLRRDEVLGTVWDSTPLDLPERRLVTSGTWLSLPLDAVAESVPLARLGAGAHGLEHLALALLPMHAPCDRWDVRGYSSAADVATGLLTVSFYDQQPAGAGFTEQAFDAGPAWLAAALARVEACRCDAGCPACVVAADCTDAQRGLDKPLAADLLRLLRPGA